MALAVGLGLAVGLANSSFGNVVTRVGGGELLMGFSTLSTIGPLKPEKMVLVILDNGTYGSTGHQPTAASATDLAGVAQACGIQAFDVDTVRGRAGAPGESKSLDVPVMIRARINLQGQKTPYFLHDPVMLAETFRQFLAEGTAS